MILEIRDQENYSLGVHESSKMKKVENPGLDKCDIQKELKETKTMKCGHQLVFHFSLQKWTFQCLGSTHIVVFTLK